MYLTNRNRYDNASGQHCRQAPFLILVQPSGMEGHKAPMRALVRKVALHQCGHWMMGSTRAFGQRIALSGCYGDDGSPCSVPQEVYDRATPVPEELIEKWNHGGGWNDAGSEAQDMRDWAIKTFLEDK